MDGPLAGAGAAGGGGWGAAAAAAAALPLPLPLARVAGGGGGGAGCSSGGVPSSGGRYVSSPRPERARILAWKSMFSGVNFCFFFFFFFGFERGGFFEFKKKEKCPFQGGVLVGIFPPPPV